MFKTILFLFRHSGEIPPCEPLKRILFFPKTQVTRNYTRILTLLTSIQIGHVFLDPVWTATKVLKGILHLLYGRLTMEEIKDTCYHSVTCPSPRRAPTVPAHLPEKDRSRTFPPTLETRWCGGCPFKDRAGQELTHMGTKLNPLHHPHLTCTPGVVESLSRSARGSESQLHWPVTIPGQQWSAHWQLFEISQWPVTIPGQH